MAQQPPSMSVTVALDATVLKEDEAVELSVTIVSHASSSITILEYSTILDIREAQKRRRPSANFQCIDLDTDKPVRLQDRICGRFDNISHKMDDSDSQYFHTLQPEVSHKFNDQCLVALRELIPGHRCRKRHMFRSFPARRLETEVVSSYMEDGQIASRIGLISRQCCATCCL